MKKMTVEEFARNFGRMGGKATFKKYGRKHYSELARKSAAKKRSTKP